MKWRRHTAEPSQSLLQEKQREGRGVKILWVLEEEKTKTKADGEVG